MNSCPHVAILIDSSRAYGRGVLEGVARYVQQHGPWSLYFQPRGLNDPPPAWLATWKGNGILARINDRRMAEAIRAAGLPAVDLRGQFPELGVPYIGPDNSPVTRLAFEHLADRGFRQFASCQLARDIHPGIAECCHLFQQHAERLGYTYHGYTPKRNGGRDISWEDEQDHFAAWLCNLPRPIGLVTWTDDCGYQVLDACRRARLSVPDEVAVVGCGNDAVLCNLTEPPMTSIDLGAAHIGYEAMAMLERMMRAPRRRWPQRVAVPPRGIVVRQSSDVLAVADREIAAAVRFIRARGCERITVEDVAGHVSLSRTMLDLRFKKALGRTTKAEILRVQVEQARLLLAESNLSLEVVARRSGFSSAKYLGDVFTREHGMRPGEYRRRFGPGSLASHR